MIIYLDSSALLKRVLDEDGTARLRGQLTTWDDSGETFVTSQLADVEVARALRSRIDVDVESREFAVALDQVMDGVARYPVDGQVVSTSQIIGPPLLRSLDAIHLATAVLLRVDRLVTYDQRMREVAGGLGIVTEQP